MRTHVALLRGVNVGGVRLAMASLRAAAESLGHTEVATYVQSGNLVLRARSRSTAELVPSLRAAVLEHAGVDTDVIVLTRERWAELVAQNPYPDETDGTKLHAVVAAQPYSEAERAAALAVRDAVRADGSADDLTILGQVLYLHLPDGMGRSVLARRLGRLKTAGQHRATARNWRTVAALQGLLLG